MSFIVGVNVIKACKGRRKTMRVALVQEFALVHLVNTIRNALLKIYILLYIYAIVCIEQTQY